MELIPIKTKSNPKILAAKKLPYCSDFILYLFFSLSTVSIVSSVSSIFLTFIKMTIPHIIITETNIINNNEFIKKKNKYFFYIYNFVNNNLNLGRI